MSVTAQMTSEVMKLVATTLEEINLIHLIRCAAMNPILLGRCAVINPILLGGGDQVNSKSMTPAAMMPATMTPVATTSEPTNSIQLGICACPSYCMCNNQ